MHVHEPLVESAVQGEPVSAQVPVDALVSASDERVAIDNCTVAPTGALPVIVKVEFDVKSSMLDEPLSEAAARSGADTAGNAYRTITIPEPPDV